MTDRTPPALAPRAAGLTPLALRILPKVPTGTDVSPRSRVSRSGDCQPSASQPAALQSNVPRSGDLRPTTPQSSVPWPGDSGSGDFRPTVPQSSLPWPGDSRSCDSQPAIPQSSVSQHGDSRSSAPGPAIPQAEAAALAALAKQGDKAATGQLIDLYTPLIRRIIRYVPFQDRPDAQADCQLALIQALRCYDPAYGMDLTGYLSLRLRRHFRNSLRLKQTRSDAACPHAEIDTIPDGRDAIEVLVRRRALDAARAALTPDEAHCIHLLYDRELSYLQAGTAMGLNEDRIDYLRKTALRKLRRRLEEDGSGGRRL